MKTAAGTKAIDPEDMVPTHCPGSQVIAAFAGEMPNRFVLNTAGIRYTITGSPILHSFGSLLGKADSSWLCLFPRAADFFSEKGETMPKFFHRFFPFFYAEGFSTQETPRYRHTLPVGSACGCTPDSAPLQASYSGPSQPRRFLLYRPNMVLKPSSSCSKPSLFFFPPRDLLTTPGDLDCWRIVDGAMNYGSWKVHPFRI